MTREELWQAVLADLELGLSKANFTTWFKNTFISEWNEETGDVVIGVPNAFTHAWLEKKYHKTILSVLREASDDKVKKACYKVEARRSMAGGIFGSESKAASAEQVDGIVKMSPAAITAINHSGVGDNGVINEFGLKAKYTFANFIVGEGNALAHAASMGVAKNLGTRYNPLFIYGGVGLGKTHLVQAIGNEILKHDPGKKIIYVSAEKFTNDYVQSLRENKINAFKTKYRSADMLLIDDVQFLSGKEQTQEEFFHTFNDLHQRECQIVLTSDRLPQSIPTLEDRLKSRFQMGVITDIAPPKLETRIAILEAKIKEHKYKLAEDVVQYLAANIQNNVRELEGALNKIAAYHEFYNTPPTMETVKNILASLTASSPNQGSVTIRQLLEVVANFFELNRQDLVMSKCRRRELALPRQIAMYLLRTELNASYPTIGHELGGRDHTTAIHAFKQIEKKILLEGRLKHDVDLIKQRLYASA